MTEPSAKKMHKICYSYKYSERGACFYYRCYRQTINNASINDTAGEKNEELPSKNKESIGMARWDGEDDRDSDEGGDERGG